MAVTSTKVEQRPDRCPPHPRFAPPSAAAIDSRPSHKLPVPADRKQPAAAAAAVRLRCSRPIKVHLKEAIAAILMPPID